MASISDPEPDQRGSIFFVGQDEAGHWLVQESTGQMEGRFVSFAAAMGFARAERYAFHAEVVVSTAPLVPHVPFMPAGADERATARAA
ncbi:hypothetical protein LQ953_10335 [Sphingomonas sp. IC-56]|uniref:hypothetical protein n=1 Tax=Sphingomonas sp. IC-56 TaxID=2898529 RepID=UPI001E55528B|nr:hypothetical protein [Sphingomonas sp. IC-56]MCD2324410.1 hypothetical protein [Sphingomonas sp. IC-56]